MGGQAFLNKFHVKPIKLNGDDLVRLHIMTQQQIKYWDDRYEQGTNGLEDSQEAQR